MEMRHIVTSLEGVGGKEFEVRSSVLFFRVYRSFKYYNFSCQSEIIGITTQQFSIQTVK